MDPIRPISTRLPPVAPLPVQRLEPITRERDRPSEEGTRRGRRKPRAGADASHDGEEDGGHGHIDVRA